MATIVYECKRLEGTGKRGILPRDPETGAYPIVVGAFGAYNSAGDFYTTEGVEQLFDRSGDLMRRVSQRKLRAEFKHPEPRPNEDMKDFLRRVRSIDDNRECATHIKLVLDDSLHKAPDGSPVITVISHVIPSGPFGYITKERLENPELNACFSVRSFTKDVYVRGCYHKDMLELITYDLVGEQGIGYAEKYLSPALEAHKSSQYVINPYDEKVLDRRTITESDITSLQKQLHQMRQTGKGPSCESERFSLESFLNVVPPEMLNQRGDFRPIWMQM